MITNFTDKNVPNQTGKTIFITGANTGIGFEAAKVFASKGARVLLGCRNIEKGKAALARIADAHPGADIDLVEIDLSDLASVHKAVEVIARGNPEQPHRDRVQHRPPARKRRPVLGRHQRRSGIPPAEALLRQQARQPAVHV